MFNVAKKIQRAGNRAVHESKPPTKLEAVEVVSALFQFCFWLAFTYGRSIKPDPSIRFDPQRLTAGRPQPRRRRWPSGRSWRSASNARPRRPSWLASGLAELTRTVEELEAERAAADRRGGRGEEGGRGGPGRGARLVGARDPPVQDRRSAGRGGLEPRRDARDREFEVHGMPSDSGVGYVDYVLWGDDGLPLALVEAKKTLVSPHGRPAAGEAVRRLPGADDRAAAGHLLLQRLRALAVGRHPVPAAAGAGVLDQGRTGAADPAAHVEACRWRRWTSTTRSSSGTTSSGRSGRSPSTSRSTSSARRCVVMATGAGKTRTVIALADLLMRANWAKRVLFLADRTALVNQAVNAFKAHLPDSAPVNLVTEGDEDGRVYVSTYQTMVGKIDEYRADGTRRFGVGHFDLVVIDEAHRSVYRKYRGIFEYFDSLLVGLTATPKDEVDKNTYDLFDLETGVPTDAYSLDDAIDDGFLVPPRGVSVPLKFVREGIRYDDLSEDEKDDWDELDWGEDEDGNPLDPPDEVDAAEVNKLLFNEDTVDKVLEHLMTDGIKVAGGDRLGKTIIFAKNQTPRRLHLRTVHRQLPAPRQRQLRPGHHPQRQVRARA